ncbi:hypothetical protein SCP_0402760 [Sparassis crispa]|uniref:Uncharacterized protein n=1 Tax=Sparassis crispa TaxID=139825 RepID=A0A401GIB0_9APHY|nr:hypothetical protein SCP_0402760 [Sparassis crispa]GBE81902.1 hypothetical protein SCP_0402760 [Sparassis crispa]
MRSAVQTLLSFVLVMLYTLTVQPDHSRAMALEDRRGVIENREFSHDMKRAPLRRDGAVFWEKTTVDTSIPTASIEGRDGAVFWEKTTVGGTAAAVAGRDGAVFWEKTTVDTVPTATV